MENIDIIIVAGVSFLLVVGGLFIGMYFARRTEAARVAKLEEREDRLLRMRARFEHERFAVSAEDSDGDVLLDEDLFKGFKEELEQERIELDMRREELELDIRMLEEENERLKSRLPSDRSNEVAVETAAGDATIVEDDIEDAVFEESPEAEETDEDIPEDASEDASEDTTEDISGNDLPPDSENDVATQADAEEQLARNTIFGDFFFDDSPDGDAVDTGPEDSDEEDSGTMVRPAASEPASEDAEPDTEAEGLAEVEEEPDAVDDGWASEPDEIEQPGLNVPLTDSVGGDGAAGDRPPDTLERSEPARAAFDHMLASDGELPADGTFEQVLGLSKSDLALMNDLGYGSFRAIADLSDEEIERLSAAFDIPERTIRDEWMPDSKKRLAREPRA